MPTFFPGNPTTGSALLCPNTLSACLVFRGGTSPLGTTQSSNVTVIGVGATPTSGSTGITFLNGYNNAVVNINSVNFDTCYLFKTPNTGGLAMQVFNPNATKCQTHYMTFDGWAEAKFFAGRIGANGPGDFAAQDYIYVTNSGCTVAGCGPNTLTFVGTQFNASAAPACYFRFGNITPGGQQPSFIKFIGVHSETPVGSGQTGVFCSDSTVSSITGLSATNSDFTPNDGLTPLFAFNQATALDEMKFAGDYFEGCSGATLAPTVDNGLFNVVFINNFGCGTFNITASPVSASLQSIGNDWEQLSMHGGWTQLRLDDHYSNPVVIDTASGGVFMVGEPWQVWTPTLTFGSDTGWAATTAGQYRRIETGGFEAQYSVNVTTVGTQTGAAATLTGMPLTCITGVNYHDVPVSAQLSGGTLQPVANFSADNIIHFMEWGGSGAFIPLTDANFASTSDAIIGMARCTQSV
jgi:hypothetical protein